MIQLWSVDSAGPVVHAKILRESKMLTNIVLTTTLIAVFMSVNLAFPDEHEAEIFFAYSIFKEWFPQEEKLLHAFYKLIVMFSVFPPMALAINFVYVVVYVRHQNRLTIHYVDNIERMCRAATKEIDLFYDEEFQDNIRKLSIFIIDRWNCVTMHTLPLLSELRSECVFSCILIVFTGISIPGFLFTVPHLITEEYINIFAVTFVSFSLCCLCFAVGQRLENDHEYGFVSLTKMNWYNYNRKNKQIYLMNLCFLLKPKQISVYGLGGMNYRLGLQMAKVIYSVVSCIATLNMNVRN